MCVCVCVCVRACVCECVSVAPTCCLQRARSTWLEPPPPVLCVRICCSAPVMRHKQTKVQMESKWLTPSLPPLLHALPSPLRTCVCMCVCVCVCVCGANDAKSVRGCADAQDHSDEPYGPASLQAAAQSHVGTQSANAGRDAHQ